MAPLPFDRPEQFERTICIHPKLPLVNFPQKIKIIFLVFNKFICVVFPDFVIVENVDANYFTGTRKYINDGIIVVKLYVNDFERGVVIIGWVVVLALDVDHLITSLDIVSLNILIGTGHQDAAIVGK